MTTLTHQERARDAADAIGMIRARGIEPSEESTEGIIHDLTYPKELVEAAKSLLRIVEGEAMIRDRHGEEFAATEIHEARAALSLYPEPEEETDFMITTTYACDRCGHEQDSWEPKYRPGGGGLEDGQQQMLEVGVYATFDRLPQAIARELTHHKVHWCRRCVDEVGLDPVRKKEREAPPELTLEDQVREIVRAEVESHAR